MRYAIHGLVVESPWELFEAPATDAQADVKVELTQTGIERLNQRPRRTASRWDVIREDFHAVIRDGRTIDVFGDVKPEVASLYIMGACMGGVLFQRGCLPFHANAVNIGNSAVLLAGERGAGKSTLAAALRNSGHQLISDDLCCLEESRDGFRVRPGYQRLRLWKESLELLGLSFHGLSRIRPELEKYLLVLNEPSPSPAALSRIYIIRSGQESGLEELRGLAKLEALDSQIYGGQIEQRHRNFPHILPLLSALARTLTVKALYRSPQTSLRELTRTIEEDCL